MIDKNFLTVAGRFQKPHALGGELNAMLDVDMEFFDEHPWMIVNMEGIPTPFRVEGLRAKGTFATLVKLAGIDSVDDARAFVNKDILVTRSDLAEFESEEDADDGFYLSDLAGYTLQLDSGKTVGRVADVDLSTESNPLLVVEQEDGGQVLVPAADEFFIDIDPEGQVVTMRLPEGLVDLNSKEK